MTRTFVVEIVFSLLIIGALANYDIGWLNSKSNWNEDTDEARVKFGILRGHLTERTKLVCYVTSPQFKLGEKPQRFLLTLSRSEITYEYDLKRALTNRIMLILSCTENGRLLIMPKREHVLSIVGRDESETHLIQSVIDINNKIQKLCYDISMPLGGKLKIFHDSISALTVWLTTADSFLVEEIEIYSKDGRLLYVRKDSVETAGGDGLKQWLGDESWWFTNGQKNGLTLELRDNTILGRYQKELRSVDFRIVKRRGYLSFYVDAVDNSYEMDKYTDGIIGAVANTEYKFYNSLDGNKENVAAKVNSRLVAGLRKKIGAKKCIYLKIKDILIPRSLKDFLWK
ncbi:DgyrCDS13590 [Dimorphilus gyrociliatus]|uniref:DgyrCDS13590 n=1 Tax=Dimorphilus gyrociliatus TaxID=2664684 RepID=A0A7I8WB67_9ANNE|nr:DgyrCDS13590 [Dimorphilus gyrociliatus]